MKAPAFEGTKMRKFGLLAIAGTALALAGASNGFGAPPQAPKAAPKAAPTTTVAPHWTQETSDLRADPAIRFGTLPNGMRYAIMKNATPPGEASLRLRIDAGSLNEQDDQRGIAHFIEHMAFNGSKNVPEGEFVRRLERHGLKFGPDTNASTNFDQTVYMLDLPETDADTVDTGLFLLREAAGEATLDPGAIDRERGIILSEERTRAGPQMRTFEDETSYLFRGDIIASRIPIGLPEIIRTAPRERFTRFYNGYYRPERTTLIAVGDFDVDAMEAKIRTRFGDWTGKGPHAPDPAPSRLTGRDTETHVFIEPGGAERVALSWVRPPDLRPDSQAERTEHLIDQLGLRIISRRLERLANSEAPPFIGASAYRTQPSERADVVQIAAVSKPGEWKKSLAAIEQERRRATEHGFTQAELDREIQEFRTALTTSAAGAATRTSPGLAQLIVNSVNEDNVVTTPADNLAAFERSVKGLTADRVAAATRALFAGKGPLVYMTSPAPIEGGDRTLLAAFDASRAVPVATQQAHAAKTWPYQSFGTPGTVAERHELADLGVTTVRFANGVRLTVKPTDFRKDEILVSARFGGGLLEMPRNGATPAWGLGAFAQGGLGKLDVEELQEVLADTVYGAGLGMSEDSFSLGGRTRPSDFARQMQVLAAFVTDAAWRPAGWNRNKASASTIHAQLRSTPGGVAGRDSGALLHSGDTRWAFPSQQAMEASNISDLEALVGPALASEPMDVTIVGDISVDEAIRQTAATLGALPPRGPLRVDVAARQVRFPAPGLVRLTHEGRADQGLAMIAWPTTDFYSDQKRARVLNLLAQVLQLRLIDEIREKQATTYSPGAGSAASETFAGYGYMSARIEAPPERLEPFLADAEKIAHDLATTPVVDDELQRARRPLIENLQRQRASSNGWWLGALDEIQERPEALESIRVSIAQYQSITPAELQAAARRYLLDAAAWKMIVVPKAS
jgi:zinc protease